MSVQLTSAQGTPLPLELVTATFLHELAHSVTPPERWRPQAIPPELRDDIPEEGPNSWVLLHHSPTFYTNFAEMLRRAEDLGIYSLPTGTKNKYSVRSLKRFDRIDPDMSMSRFSLGKCNLPLLANRSNHQRQRLKLVITDTQRTKKKPVVLDLYSSSDDVLSVLLSVAKAKLNLKKKPSRVTTVQGEEIVDSLVLMNIPDESLIVILL